MDPSDTSKPKKSILKTPSNFQENHGNHAKTKMTWDEQNINETFHPENKTYGHKKIDEPKTPFNYMSDCEDHKNQSFENPQMKMDPEELIKKLDQQKEICTSDQEDEHMSREAEARRRSFEQQRKLHYNEFLAAKLARISHEATDDEAEEHGSSNAPKPMDTGAADPAQHGADNPDNDLV